MSIILGLSAFYHDSAAAILRDGVIVAAVQEERFSRQKYDARLPVEAIRYCLEQARIEPEAIDYVAFYEQPLTKFERLIETYVACAPAGFSSFRQALPVWLRDKLHIPRRIRKGLADRFQGRILYPSHHESHAASAFLPSPFEEAAILTLDGVGEWSTTTIGHGRGNRIEVQREIRFPHSLGLLYSAFTSYCGFKVNAGEYKLMGLAPYGEPRYFDQILERLIDLKDDGSYALDLSYFSYPVGLRMTNDRFHRLLGGPPRTPESRLDQRHMDLAASIQKVCEEVVLRSGRHAWEITGRPRNLVMAGGVALNCVANGRLLREGPFENIWIQPASGDAGGALGAALFTWHQILSKPRTLDPAGRDSQQASLLGPRYSVEEIVETLDGLGACYRRFDDEPALLDHVAEALAVGRIVGWFHGRAEFGPRALGARSILGDPRNPRMQAELNLKIKFRESFRPFAPCVLREHVHEWFDMRPGEESPYMLLVAPVRDEHRVTLTDAEREALRHDPDLGRRVNLVRSTVPAITHVDHSARVQTVDERHGRFQRLMRAFHARTGCPIVVNTSFNMSWEPIVLTPLEAYHAFMQSSMDVLVLEDCILHKSQQPLGLTLWCEPDHEGPPPESSPWADSETGEPLVVTPDAVITVSTGASTPVIDGIPRPCANWSSLRDEGDPSINPYEDAESPRDLLEKARAFVPFRLLGEQIPYGARVIEVGCGAGFLTNFLAIAHRTVLGIDENVEALRIAQAFRSVHGIDRAAFAHMNLDQPGLRSSFFDVVIASGALIESDEPSQTLRDLARLVRPGGHLVAFVPDRFGRPLAWLSNRLGRGSRQPGLPRNGRVSGLGLNDVLNGLTTAGLEFVNAIPAPEPDEPSGMNESLFQPRDPGTATGRFLNQIAHAGQSAREGGTFLLIARRPGKLVRS